MGHLDHESSIGHCDNFSSFWLTYVIRASVDTTCMPVWPFCGGSKLQLTGCIGCLLPVLCVLGLFVLARIPCTFANIMYMLEFLSAYIFMH